MRILIHDFGGYAFVLQLSTELASRGHDVFHFYCASLTTTPPGVVDTPGPDSLTVRGIHLPRPLQKYNFLKRWIQEKQYGRLAAQYVEQVQPDLVLSANTPLDAQRLLQAACRSRKIPFVFWLQDVIGVAADSILSKKLPGVGHLVGRHYIGMERTLLRQSEAVVAITSDFEHLLAEWGVSADRVFVIENWAAIDEIPQRLRENPWTSRLNLTGRFRFLYAGTLSMKHDPSLLLQLAFSFKGDENVRVVVISQGSGADWLREAVGRDDPGNLVILDYQAKEDLADVLAAADVLLAVLDSEAGIYSVPSKVLTYLCAGRPILLAAPENNLASRQVGEKNAGVVVPAGDVEAFLSAARRLHGGHAKRQELGENARAYAEAAFDITAIADRFEDVLRSMPSRDSR